MAQINIQFLCSCNQPLISSNNSLSLYPLAKKAMPAWWPRKSKSKSKPKKSESASCSSSPHPITDENAILKTSSNDKKEKANSFDETVARKAAAAVSNGHGQVFAFGQHPLPRPLSSPLPSVSREILVLGSGSVSASESSVSSSGSEETPDLTFYRYAATINVPKGNGLASEHPRSISVSPRKEYNHQTTSENIFSSVHVMRGNTRPTSPMHPKSVGVCPGSPNMCPSSPKLRHEEMKSPPHPLPLPPSSPGSSTRSNSCTQLNPSQWKKGKLLGRGTFGQVYTGFNRENGQMCAIKEVKVISDDSNSKECLRQLNQEITLLSQLSHPNIVQYHGSELVDDTLSVYLEYVSGGSIHKLLQEYGPFGEPVIRSYARQILSGLAYLHGRNTVHRDIKGANILVDPNGEVKLADFGMAKHISAYTSIRSFKGSPYWMAPEVIMNGNGYNLSVDIWSLGCTVLEMATSKPPWSQFEGVAAIFKIGNSKDIPEIPDHLSSDAKSFLKLCLQRDPAGRPTAIQLMDHPFVRDQPSNKTTKLNVFRDSLPSISAETRRLGAMDLSPNRSLSPLRDNNYRVGHLVEFPSSSRNQSDLQSMRMNMSLPVSPCSSPLRQVNNQYTRSCLPSPPHPAYSANAVNHGPSNYALYPSKHGSSMFDAWQEDPQLRAQSAYGSPRR